ncbi:MAG TPA: VOC family protein [Bryobacteraceae bacterium]|jgi:catechol 2,3-dioxygenase-like lactoylglutathione lyase family enzyme
MQIESIHHVALCVTDLERSRRFYRDILALREIARPPFDFPGAWFEVAGGQQLHLIVHPEATLRGPKGLDTRDNHLAIRVRSYRDTLEFLRSKGFREDVDNGDARKIRASIDTTAGFPQIYILDPDRHVIEINTERPD